MRRCVPLFALATALLGAVGCKSAGKATEVPGEAPPPLLIGPEATSKAPPPVELPAKESAKLCVRTAQYYEKEGRVEDAIKLYEKARLSDPATARQASRRLAVLYDKFGDFSKSAAEYEAQIKAAPHDAELLTDFGYSHYCRGDWATAETALLKAVQADPNQKRAWVNLGMAQAQLGKWDESLRSFSKAVRPADAQCNIAFVLASQGNTDDAKERYRLALSLDPGLRVAQIGLSTLENPKPTEGKPDATKASEKSDPETAAARVPTIAEIEARMKSELSGTPVVVPAPEQKSVNP